MLVWVPPIVVDEVWPSVEPFVNRALAKVNEYRFNAGHVLDQIREANVQLWVDGAPLQLVVITEMRRYPQALELNIGPIAGTLPDDWEISLKGLEAWGKAQGCTHIATLGRPGWQRKTKWDSSLAFHVRKIE